MGIAFTRVEQTDQIILQKWIGEQAWTSVNNLAAPHMKTSGLEGIAADLFAVHADFRFSG